MTTESDDRRDAERYRLLRSMHWHEGPYAVVENPRNTVKLGTLCPSGEHLDYVLDGILKERGTT